MMIKLFIELILTSAAVLIIAYILPGVHVDGFLAAFLTAVVLAIVNAFIKPFLVLITIPLTVITLGLFILVINATMILIADWVVPDFHVYGFWWALLFSLILSLFTTMFRALADDGATSP